MNMNTTTFSHNAVAYADGSNGSSDSVGAIGSYAASVSLKEVVSLAAESIQAPPLNREYVKSIAAVRGPEGETEVRSYHDRFFNEKNAELLARCHQMKERITSDRVGIIAQLQELSRINKHTDRYQELNRESIPWTKFSRIQVLLLVLFSLLLLAVGINTTGQILMNSGIPGFEHAWRAYLFSLIPIGLAFGFKYLRVFLTEQHRKTRYTLAIWSMGLFFGVVWAVLFAQTFPAITQSTADIINSISLDQSKPNHGHVAGIILIVVSILAESLLAAGCWLTIETIVERHQPSTRINNPAYEKTQSDVNEWLKRKYEQDDICGKIDGKIRAIEEAKHRFADEAAALFHVARAASAQQKQLSQLLQ